MGTDLNLDPDDSPTFITHSLSLLHCLPRDYHDGRDDRGEARIEITPTYIIFCHNVSVYQQID